MNLGMDWIALHEHPLWEALWGTDQVKNKIKGLEAALIGGKETDPHTLGKQRGELQALRWLCDVVGTNAKAQRQEPEQPQPAWEPRRVRIR